MAYCLIGSFKLSERIYEINRVNLSKLSRNSDKGLPLFLNEKGEYLLMMHWAPHWTQYWKDGSESRVDNRAYNEKHAKSDKCVGVILCKGFSMPSEILKSKDLALNLYPEYEGCVTARFFRDSLTLEIYLDEVPKAETRVFNNDVIKSVDELKELYEFGLKNNYIPRPQYLRKHKKLDFNSTPGDNGLFWNERFQEWLLYDYEHDPNYVWTPDLGAYLEYDSWLEEDYANNPHFVWSELAGGYIDRYREWNPETNSYFPPSA